MKKGILKKDKYSIVATILSFLIALLICVSMFLPRNIGNVLTAVGKPVETLSTSKITAKYGCQVDEDGNYKITGNDPQIILSCSGKEAECIEINITSPDDELVGFEVFTAFSDGAFSSERCYAGRIYDGKESAVIDLPKGEYYAIRIDIDKDNVVFENIEIYDKQPTSTPFVPSYSLGDYLKAILIPLVIALIVWFVDSKTNFAKRSTDAVIKNRLKIAEFIVFTVLAILVGVLMELIVGLASSAEFNKYRCVFFCGACELIVIFISGYKNLKEKAENLFLPIALVLGLVMLFASPAKHIAWDLDSHYPWAVQTSYLDTAYITSADYNVDKYLDQSMLLAGFDLETYNRDIEYLNAADEVLIGQTEAAFSLAHLPAGIFMAVARFFGASFEFKYNFGRLAYLLVYSFVCYFAIKKLKSGKMILAVICLFPTNLFLATNYTYDWCVTAFTILGTAYFVSELQEPDKPITIKDTVIMGLAFVVGAWSKLVYIILMGMTFFMRKNWQNKKQKRKYYLVIISIFVALFAYFMITTLVKMGGEGDARGGDVNPTAQMMGILADPFEYAKLLFKFLAQYLSFGTMKEYISHFAYLGIGKYWIVIAVLLLVVMLTDASSKVSFKIPIYMKVLSVLLFVGMAALIATALYINFTPLNSQTISGCQPRYITPLLAPLLLLVTGQRFNVVKNKSIYNGIVLAVSSLTVMLEIYNMIVIRMI